MIMPEISKHGRWRFKCGGYGSTVWVKELTPGGNVYLEWWDAEVGQKGGYRRRSLRFAVRADGDTPLDEVNGEAVQEAKDQARDLSDRLEKDQRIVFHDRTLGTVSERYIEVELPHKDPAMAKRRKRDIALLKRHFGTDYPLDEPMTQGEFNRLRRLRESGTLDARGRRVEKRSKREPVKAGTASKPLATLRTLCRWATEQRVGTRGARRRLLESDPTQGLDLVPKGEADPEPDRRDLTYDDDECRALLQVADRVVIGRPDRDGNRLSYMPALLILAMKTGRRISSIIALKRSDLLLDDGGEGGGGSRIRWRADEDKTRTEWITPVLPAVTVAVKRQMLKTGGSEWLFPAPRSEGHVSRYLVGNWLPRAEELTHETDDVQSVEHVDGRGWHGFRRRWAIKRKHLPVQDVAELGGWKTIETLQQIYQQPDDASMHRALEGGEDRRLAL